MKLIVIENDHADYLARLLSEQRLKAEALRRTQLPASSLGRRYAAEVARIDSIRRAIDEAKNTTEVARFT